MRLLRPAAVGGAAVGLVLLTVGAAPAAAHPLGNFSVNVYAGLEVRPRQVVVDYVLDLAEVATLQALPFMDEDGDGHVTDAERVAYGEAGCAQWTGQLAVEEEGERLPLRTEESRTTSLPGEANLSTLRIECRQVADRPAEAGERTIVFTDGTLAQRKGWREVTATGDGVTLVASDVPATSLSARLTSYPEDRLSSPVDQRSARLVTRPGGPVGDRAAAPAAALAAGGWSEALNDLVEDRMLGRGLVAAAVLAALALGILHALAPGHGKAVIAAYLVGQRGSVRQAGALALSVALTHTAGVLVLGALLWTASLTAPERLYPVLGVASGAVIAGLGAGMLTRAWRTRSRPAPGAPHAHHHPEPVLVGALARRARGHDAAPGHRHAHPHRADEHRPAAAERLRAGTVVALGFAGGLVPTPSALIVLLGSLAVGRVGFGVALVAVYGLGMALALTGIGLALAHARSRLERRLDRLGSARLHGLAHALPVVTATFVLLAGVVLMARSAVSA